MHVQVNTDHNIVGSAGLEDHVQTSVAVGLGRFEQLTRVEVHLSDDNGAKSHGDDKRCLIEARPGGLPPVVVHHVAATVDDALEGAIDKMSKVLTRTFDKLRHAKGGTPTADEPVV